MKFNRDELLPTKQDAALKYKNLSVEELDEVFAQENKITEGRYQQIEETCLAELTDAADHCNWGVLIDTIKLEGFELKDYQISGVLDKITASIIAIDREKVRGDLEVAEEEQSRYKQIKETEMQSSVKIEKANADALVKKAEAEAAAEVKTSRAMTNADDALNKAKTENAAKVKLAQDREGASAKARAIKLDVENKEIKSAAKAEAESIELLAEAAYEQKIKENEAAEKMSDMQFNLQMAHKSVRAMEALSAAAWRMPDKVLEFYQQFSPMLGLETKE